VAHGAAFQGLWLQGDGNLIRKFTDDTQNSYKCSSCVSL
jgi:hypothetical protein